MIIAMEKVRVLGPRSRLDEALEALQNLGVVHLDRPHPNGPLKPLERTGRHERRKLHLERSIEDVERVLAALPDAAPGRSSPRDVALAPGVRLARRLRRELDRSDEERRRLEAERASLDRYERYFQAFERLVPAGSDWASGRGYFLILSAGGAGIDDLRAALEEALGDAFALVTADAGGEDTAAVLLVREERYAEAERWLAEAGVEELPLAGAFAELPLGQAIPAMRARRAEIDRRLAQLVERRRAIESVHGARMHALRSALHDGRLEMEARELALQSPRAFVLEGWVPASEIQRTVRRLADRFGDEVVVERVGVEAWTGEEAPVVLSNPRLFRPFEAITRLLPLPRYGSIDPTPFVAVFFPMFFGIILGDVAYGLALAALAAVLHRRSRAGTLVRSVAEIAGACSAFTIVFGFLYGELLGDLGRSWLGMRPVFDREEAVLPFLAFTVAVGVVHIVLGLGLGAVETFRTQPRVSIGRAVSALLVLLIATALLAAARILPERFFTPAVVAILVAFPVLVVAEGVLAPIELLSTLGRVLSYARIMALGTASIVMAVVANRMVGAMGGAVIGVLFGLLFHLVNFAIGIFGPVIHGLRLHYVEFFGTFHSPGGVAYRPFAHWRPGEGAALNP